MKRTIVAGALALASAATYTVAIAPTVSAAPQACVSTSLTTGDRELVGGTARKSATSTCNDLNLTKSDDKSLFDYDYYAGRLQRSDGSWFTCSRGYAHPDEGRGKDIRVDDGNHSVNDSKYWLCTAVNDNTRFTVASWYDGGDTVTITH